MFLIAATPVRQSIVANRDSRFQLGIFLVALVPHTGLGLSGGSTSRQHMRNVGSTHAPVFNSSSAFLHFVIGPHRDQFAACGDLVQLVLYRRCAAAGEHPTRHSGRPIEGNGRNICAVEAPLQ
eukprot:GHVU01163628.1.p1 GENE.GHVU01163628.1~~GHVU01163628.1.p1  ORF type:complete len:123 (+),score=0.88 GHVU01163628.1:2083-2451(+)